jgi:hypothetical protein
MNAIQQTAKIDPSRRLLRLDKPLPAAAGTGQVNITVSIPVSSTEPRRGVGSENRGSPLEKTPPKAAASGENSPTPITDMLCGLLAHVGDISKEQIREDRLQRWLS